MARRNPFSKKAGGGLRMKLPIPARGTSRKRSGEIVKNPLCGVKIFGGQEPRNQIDVAPPQRSGGMFGFVGSDSNGFKYEKEATPILCVVSSYSF
jgi:hypothetical protein